MKKLLFIASCIPIWLQAQTPANDPAWLTTKKFSDDFANTSQWTSLSIPWGSSDFSFDASRININTTILPGNNVLELSAIYNSSTPILGSPFWGNPISSGYMFTNSPFTYGYYEARCNFNSYGDSYMPAFWLFKADACNWYDEIDVEIFSKTQSSGDPFDLTTNTHWQRTNCVNYSDFQSYTPSSGLQSAWHKYGIEWTPDHIVFYYDDVPYRIKAFNNKIPDHSMQILLDLGFNGSGNHTINNDFTTNHQMYVDYVNAYDLDMTECTATDASFTSGSPFNAGSYNYKTKRRVTFSNGSSTSLTTGNITLRASDYTLIDVNADFTVQGADFTILPTQCY